MCAQVCAPGTFLASASLYSVLGWIFRNVAAHGMPPSDFTLWSSMQNIIIQNMSGYYNQFRFNRSGQND